jgi:hypothetical protein
MAAIDPSIALGVTPLKIENPMAQYAMMSQIQAGQNQNALAQYQLSAAQRGDEATNVQNQLYAKHYDPKKGTINQPAYLADLAAYGQGSLIPKAITQFTEQQHKENVNAKTVAETTQKKLEIQKEQFANLAFNPSNENVKAHLQDSVLKGELPQAQADQLWAKVANLNPAQRSQYFTEMGMKAHELGTYKETVRSHKVNEGIAGGNLAVNQGQLNLAKQKFAFETNPEKVGNIAEAKKTGELNATDKLAKAKTIEGATQILKDIRYDPKTKDNDVSKLIDISTGSYGGAAINLGNRIFGRSTEGSKAIAELKTIESKITTDLLGGKLGSGISNADRDFIQQQVGLIGNETLPTGDRKAAWNRVVERLNNVASRSDW